MKTALACCGGGINVSFGSAYVCRRCHRLLQPWGDVHQHPLCQCFPEDTVKRFVESERYLDTVHTTADPAVLASIGWSAAPDCDRCKDTGWHGEPHGSRHCGCKTGRRMFELGSTGKDVL